MSGTVDLNTASERQIKALLGVTDRVLRRIVAGRPFDEPEALKALLPKKAQALMIGLSVRKRDINTADADLLQEAAGLTSEQAAAVLAVVPVQVMFELARLPEIDAEAFGNLIGVFTANLIRYTDKLSGRAVELVPSTDELVLRLRDADAAAAPDMAARLHALARPAGDQGTAYAVYRVPQTESPTEALTGLSGDDRVSDALVSFRDADGVRRMLDPRYCLVQFEAAVTPQRQDELLARIGLAVAERHRSRGLVTARLADGATGVALQQALTALNAQPEVRFAEPAFMGFDDKEGGVSDAASAGLPLPWHLDFLAAPAAWSFGDGTENVVIAIIDTGVDASHSALSDAVLRREPDDHWNFEDDATPAPYDEDGHGTFIAGLCVGNGAHGVRGLAPKCRVLPLRVPLTGSPSAYARRRDAILYAVERIRPPKRLIINLSWKTAGDVAAIRDAIDMAAGAGALVVASAGNWPLREGQPHFPSDYAPVISVGAVGSDGRRAVYSFFGNALDLAAPGGNGPQSNTNLVSAAPGDRLTADFGTSFAAPLVCATAALVWSYRPEATAEEVRATLEGSALPVIGAGLGRGIVSAAAALEAAGAVEEEPDPRPEPDRSGQPVLSFLNDASLDELVGSFGLLRITARLIMARRPLAAVADLWPALGLSEDEYQAIQNA